ncbi:hypothetical protein Ahy_A05g025697 [Arachis hypogaea]|uniref:Aminotransferase-like plant mobile domain-containing protein n=1 Tax=Arachis hypogaea TaxID=3818 RepID=A0A445D991_ARAHY|nr:hypothetical protein Ahy_A05g025697 [Arachis hypogaea]
MEITITLKEVAYQLGLRIDGDPVSGSIAHLVPQHDLWRAGAGRHRGVPVRYTRGYIMQLIGGILFLDAFDSWMCWATEHGQRNLGGCVSLMLSWAYHRIPLVRPDGFDTRHFHLVERWVQYRLDNATGESRLRHYRRTLNGIGMLNVEWTLFADPQLVGLPPPVIDEAEVSATVVCPLLCFTIVEWHQVDWVVRQFGGL